MRLRREFAGLRTGRASVSLLEPITVEAYGQAMPLESGGHHQRARAAYDHGPGLGPLAGRRGGKGDPRFRPRSQPGGGGPADPRADPTALRGAPGQEITKIAGKYAEQARVAVRNVRRDGMDQLKQMEKDGELSQDEHHLWSDEFQSLTDDHVKQIDEALAQKEQEIMQV